MRYWHIALVSLVALIVTPPAVADTASTVAGTDASAWTPFFDSGALQDSGWASCSEPIGVSIDTSKFLPAQVNRIDQALTRVVELWSQQGEVSFTFAGIIPMDYNTATGVLTPHDGIDRDRHIYIGFVRDADSPQFSNRVVGLGEPVTVNTANREITAGEATFERDYVTRATIPELVAVIGHEFGHALGLGHSTSKADVMYPIVSRARRLGPGDIAGLKALARPCGAPTPSRDYPVPT